MYLTSSRKTSTPRVCFLSIPFYLSTVVIYNWFEGKQLTRAASVSCLECFFPKTKQKTRKEKRVELKLKLNFDGWRNYRDAKCFHRKRFHFLYILSTIPVSYRSSRYFERESMFFWHEVWPLLQSEKEGRKEGGEGEADKSFLINAHTRVPVHIYRKWMKVGERSGKRRRRKSPPPPPPPPFQRKGVKRLIYRRWKPCAKSKYVSLLSLLTPPQVPFISVE